MHLLRLALGFAALAAIGRLLFARWREREIERGQLERWKKIVADAKRLGFEPNSDRSPFVGVTKSESWGRILFLKYGPWFDDDDASARGPLGTIFPFRSDAYFGVTVATDVELPRLCLWRRTRPWHASGSVADLGRAFVKRYRVDLEGSPRSQVVDVLAPIVSLLIGSPIFQLKVEEQRNPKTLHRLFLVTLATELHRLDEDFDLAAMLEILRRFVTSQQH